MKNKNTKQNQAVIRKMIALIGDDPDREGLLETPSRVIKSWEDLYSGYNQDPKDVLKVFEEYGKYDGMVLLKGFEMYSTCEHHMIPFTGTANVAYIPNDKVVGISKLARLVEIFARRLQIQEKLTADIANALMDHLEPKGVAVTIEAKHMCMCARGINKQHGVMETTTLLGCFKDVQSTRQEYLSRIVK